MLRSILTLLGALLVAGCTPVRPLAMPVPRYPDMLRSASIMADVPVHLSIGRAGEIQAIRIDTLTNIPPGAPDLFTVAIRRALSGARFEPARRFGVPVAARTDLTFRFVLRRPATPLRPGERLSLVDSLPTVCPSTPFTGIIVICEPGYVHRSWVVY
jgi:hypothetical protein